MTLRLLTLALALTLSASLVACGEGAAEADACAEWTDEESCYLRSDVCTWDYEQDHCTTR